MKIEKFLENIQDIIIDVNNVRDGSRSNKRLVHAIDKDVVIEIDGKEYDFEIDEGFQKLVFRITDKKWQ